jgi:succinoglycan biosynthesis protein ExoM
MTGPSVTSMLAEPVGARATVCVCVCTYKRPELLKRTLQELCRQTSESFTYSIVVADNDCKQSAKNVVSEVAVCTSTMIKYCVEPEQNIALARNRAVRNADAEYVAFIDDDEFPAPDWLSALLRTCKKYKTAGVLGPVRPFFAEDPPRWLTRSRLCERPEHDTGCVLHWKQTRTGNVLFRHEILDGIQRPFRSEFGNGGEDQDFFRRMMQRGHRFVWCNEAVVYEVVPPERRRRRYFLKRALLRGQNEKLLLNPQSIGKSLLAIPLYSIVLVFTPLIGQHQVMKYSVRLLDHVGKLLTAVGIKSIRGKYLN